MKGLGVLKWPFSPTMIHSLLKYPSNYYIYNKLTFKGRAGSPTKGHHLINVALLDPTAVEGGA